jgi:VTC domain
MTALVTAAVLDPITLDELVERASLQTRVDRKYLVPHAAAEQVVAGLAGAARVLEMGGRRDFGYASLYLDTPELTSYHLAARGRRRRFKVRRRSYLDSGQSFLEVKTRGGRGSTVKERTPAGDGVLDAAGRCFVDEVLGRAGIAPVAGALQPVLGTGYQRTTLHLAASETAADSRVTVDTHLVWSLPGGPQLELPGVAIVETKSSSTPSAADRLLWRHGHRPTRVSKYGTGLAALHEHLPANKWHPVLRRHFDLDVTPIPQERTAS